MVHMRRVNLVVFAALVAMGSATAICAPARENAGPSISGVVRDSGGVAQIGAVVQLLRPDLTVLAVVYTDSEGWFTIPSVLPGKYAIKAMGTSFLPSLRENVRVRTTTVVNLTLNTLYEAMQWLPSQPRGADAQPDDWKWTLRSAANRPLLRWLEDGPLVVVSDGTGKTPKLKARLMATGQAGTFGESGERISSAVEETPSNCWRGWIFRRKPTGAWNRCWASARIWDLPVLCSRWLPWRFTQRWKRATRMGWMKRRCAVGRSSTWGMNLRVRWGQPRCWRAPLELRVAL